MKIKVYVMHSEKIDYKNEIYKPLLELRLMNDYFLVLPLTNSFGSKYIKELLNECDIVICDLTKFNFLSNIELNFAKKLNKSIYYYINKNDKNIKKYKNFNPIIYETKEDFSNKVKTYLDSLNKNQILLNREDIYCLGKIVK